MCAEKSLDALRREIDRIDDAIHDLVRRRTEVVERVGEHKRNEKIRIRPAREDEILYRLIARHDGAFPKRALVHMWRELIVATLCFEGPFSVAVHTGDDDSRIWDLARDHYGSFTPMTAHQSVRRVIDAVQNLNATVGILPLPRRDDADPWWRHLVTSNAKAPRIITRLPFAEPEPGRGEAIEALVICLVGREPTRRDRSFLAVEVEQEPGLTRLGVALADAGFAPRFTAGWRDPDSAGPWLYLAEVEGAVAADDRRLGRLRETLAMPVNRIIHLGGYGIPLSAEELASPPADGGPKAAARESRKTSTGRKRRS